MPTTCDLIAKNILASDTASITFSSIPGTGYTDLLVCVSARAGGNAVLMRFNGDTQNIYSARHLEGGGNNFIAGYTELLTSRISLGVINSPTDTANAFGSAEAYIPNYASSFVKSAVTNSVQVNNSGTNAYIDIGAAIWDNNTAISSITLYAFSGNLIAGSSFFLYGITKA